MSGDRMTRKQRNVLKAVQVRLAHVMMDDEPGVVLVSVAGRKEKRAKVLVKMPSYDPDTWTECLVALLHGVEAGYRDWGVKQPRLRMLRCVADVIAGLAGQTKKRKHGRSQ